jgi:hypothetical protein
LPEHHVPTKKLKGFFALIGIACATALMSCGSNLDTAPVTAAAIVITSPSGSIVVDGTMQFVATVTDANGNTITETPVWTLVNGGGTITTAGMFTAGDSIGTFTNTIVATIGSVTSTSTVVVSAGGLSSITVSPDTITLQVGATHQYTAIGHDAHGHVVPIPGRVWSAAESAGTIDTSGMFAANLVAGTTVAGVTATSGSISGTAKVIVSPGELYAISVSPDTVSLNGGATQQFTAVGKDSYGNVVAIEPTWQATASSVTSSGVFTAPYTPGTYDGVVRAVVGGIHGSATVIVNPGPLYSILISPENPIVIVGTTLQFTATGHDAGGYIVPIVPVWSIAPASAAAGTISSTGMFTASMTQSNYVSAIVATSGSIVGTTNVQVFNPIIWLPPCMPYCGIPTGNP